MGQGRVCCFFVLPIFLHPFICDTSNKYKMLIFKQRPSQHRPTACAKARAAAQPFFCKTGDYTLAKKEKTVSKADEIGFCIAQRAMAPRRGLWHTLSIGGRVQFLLHPLRYRRDYRFNNTLVLEKTQPVSTECQHRLCFSKLNSLFVERIDKAFGFVRYYIILVLLCKHTVCKACSHGKIFNSCL